MVDFGDQVAAEMARLKKYAVNLCRDIDKAEDLVQDTMLCAIERQQQFIPGSNLAAWLTVIQRNVFLTWKRRPKRVVEDADGTYEAAMTSSDDTLAALVAKDALSHLSDLPSHSREILVMAADGLTLDEMVDRAKVPLGTVKSRLYRARAQFAQVIGETVGAA